jgi:hypothetical protein
MTKKFIIVFAPWIFLLLSSEGFSQNNVDILVVDAEGRSVIINHDMESARNNAIRNALQKVVEHAVLTLIPHATAAEKAQIIKDSIYAKSDDYVHDYRIISEKQDQTIYKVEIKSKISVSTVRDSLQALGLLTVAMNKVAFTTAVISVQGLYKYADYSKVKELMKTRVRGMRTFHPQRLEGGMAKLVLHIQDGNIQSVADELMQTGQFSVRNISADQNYMEVTFLQQK